MNRAELEHAIRAACDVADDSEVYVLGSQAILGEHPDAPEGLRQSAEVDVAPKHHPERADAIDGALGELSRFHETFGFYVHGISLDAATLPEGWRERVARVRNDNTYGFTGLCLEAHDLAVSKLVAFREKDREFVRILLREALVSPETLLERLTTLSVDREEVTDRIRRWVERTAVELGR